MKKLMLMVLFTIVKSESYSINLPQGLCDAQEVTTQKTCTRRGIEFSQANPVFLVTIHGTFSSSQQLLKAVVLSHEKIPSNFFEDSRYNNVTPVRLTFDWNGTLSDSARIAAGKQLAHGINQIAQQCAQQQVIPKFILVAHSHGGNLVAVASHFVSKPIDYAIIIGTPVLHSDQNIKYNNDKDLYLPRAIKQLFLFYSMQDFIQTVGAGTTDFKRRFGPINGIDLYNVRLLFDGKEALHIDLYNQLVDDHILALCAHIKAMYPKNKNLVANIAPTNPMVDNLVAIRTYYTQKLNPYTGQATDALWPNWQAFTYDADKPDEAALSNKARELFKQVYGKEFTDTAPLLDRTARAGQEVVCSRIIGNAGSGLAVFNQKIKTDLGTLCCRFDSFKNQHPRASAALNCNALHFEKETLSDKENEDLCVNVFGATGRQLGVLPTAAKDDLKKRCCKFDAFKNKHPNAAKTIGC